MKKSAWKKAIEISKETGRNIKIWEAIEHFIDLADKDSEFQVEYFKNTKGKIGVNIRHMMVFEQPYLLCLQHHFPGNAFANVTHDLSSGSKVLPLSAPVSMVTLAGYL